MKILSARQIKQADEYTIANEPISSLDLMERAACVLRDAFLQDFGRSGNFWMYCGPGNNGGDGLALARLLYASGVDVRVFVVKLPEQGTSADFDTNLERGKKSGMPIVFIETLDQWESPSSDEVLLVDALFGSGLNRPLEGGFKEVVGALNALPNTRVAIDIPSGLFADDNVDNDLRYPLKADFTYTLQAPKLSFMHRDTASLVGELKVLDIGIHPGALKKQATLYHYFTSKEARAIYRPRQKFTFKNSFGHALLMAGSANTPGAALLSARACMRAGTGLLDVALPKGLAHALHTYLPEAMPVEDKYEDQLGSLPPLQKYQAIGFGPGIGQEDRTARLLEELLEKCTSPLVMDADALNLLAKRPALLGRLPGNTVLTPHIGEFKRLLQQKDLSHDYLLNAQDFCRTHELVMVLKDSISSIIDTKGNVYFIDEGSPALATAGSGDVLTGVILALLANGYTPLESALLGVFLHAMAGRSAGEEEGIESTIASDIIDELGKAFISLKN